MTKQTRPDMITVVCQAPQPIMKKSNTIDSTDKDVRIKFQPIASPEQREWVPVRPKLVMSSLLLDE